MEKKESKTPNAEGLSRDSSKGTSESDSSAAGGDTSTNSNTSGLLLSLSGYRTPNTAAAFAVPVARTNIADQQQPKKAQLYRSSSSSANIYQPAVEESLAQITSPPLRPQQQTLGQIAARFQQQEESSPAARKNVVFTGEELLSPGHNDDSHEDTGGEHEDDQGDQSTGRWTKKEHELFLQGLKKYGKEWKKVAALVKTRTVVQTRTHAQKYFQKLAKGTGQEYSLDDDHNPFLISAHEKATPEKRTSARKLRPAGTHADAAAVGGGRRSPSPPGYYRSGGHERDGEDDYFQSSSQRSRRCDYRRGGGGHEDMMDIDDQDDLGYYPLEEDAMLLLQAQHHESSSSAIPPRLFSRQFNEDDNNGSNFFSLPSPAACGKRKADELKAAHMLAGSHSTATLALENDGIVALSRLREDGDNVSTSNTRQQQQQQQPMKRNKAVNVSLSIVNPIEGGFPFASNSREPGTPWDSQIRALNVQRPPLTSHTPAAMPQASAVMMPANLGTPAEQKQFIHRVQKLVRSGDAVGLRELLESFISAEGYHHHHPHHPQSFPQEGIEDSNSKCRQNDDEDHLKDSEGVVVNTADASATAAIKQETDDPPTAESKHIDDESDQEKVANAQQDRLQVIARILRDAAVPLITDALSIDPTICNQATVVEITRLLIEYGANATAVIDQQGNTALHLAAQQGLEKVGPLLLREGCAINAVNRDGDAAVHLAAIAGHGPFLEMLAQLGANFHLRNGQALGPMDLAGFASKDPGEREVLRRLMLCAEPRLRTAVLYHPDFQSHTARKPSDWEGPDRLVNIMQRVRDRKEFPAYELEISAQFEKADVGLLGRVHSPEYLAFVSDLNQQFAASQADGGWELGTALPFTPQVQRHLLRQRSVDLKASDAADTSFSAGTLTAARRAAGAVAHAVDLVLLGRNRNVFCAIRPPGHHAGYRGLLNGADSHGFCIFNNVAAGALHALEEHKCRRVAIVDLDIHHGNGTEDIVRLYPQPERLFFFSLHLYDNEPSLCYRFYPGSGDRNDYLHNVMNVPLQPLWRSPAYHPPKGAANTAASSSSAGGSAKKGAASEDPHHLPPSSSSSSSSSGQHGSVHDDPIMKQLYGKEAYRHAVTHKLLPALRAFHPDLILLSMGFDAAAGDVGNCRHMANSAPIRGMDLLPEDFAWATTEVMKIADICCSGRVVSVLEGGYGEYDHKGGKSYATRTRNNHASLRTPPVEIDAHAVETVMNRHGLADAAAAHIHRLIDPYGPLRISRNRGDSFAAPCPPPSHV